MDGRTTSRSASRMLPRCCFRVKATPLYPTLDTGAGERRVVSHLNTLASAPW